MNVRLNGRAHELEAVATLRDAVKLVAGEPGSERGIAVALNGEVVARSRWDETRLSADDRVEVLRAVGGG
ncbi:MAG TPA: sulfur carrier protein ThiS [Actinomycetota bacterium]|nr:sulfur carrier protein ThiS [Actinomycetota bacterium]